MSLGSESDKDHAQYLHGVILARIEGERPPVHVGAKVRPNKESISPRNYSYRGRQLPQVLTVEKILYLGQQTWHYLFKEQIEDITVYRQHIWELVPFEFLAEDFDLIEESAPAQA